MRRLMSRRLQRQRHDLVDQRGGERRNAGRPGLIAQQAIDTFGHEPPLPAPHAGLRLARRRHDRGGAQAIASQQNNPRSPHYFCGDPRAATSASRRALSDAVTTMLIVSRASPARPGRAQPCHRGRPSSVSRCKRPSGQRQVQARRGDPLRTHPLGRALTFPRRWLHRSRQQRRRTLDPPACAQSEERSVGRLRRRRRQLGGDRHAY